MRKDGIAVPKHYLKEHVSGEGDLLVMDTQDDHLRRMVKVAKFSIPNYVTYVLFDPHLVWLNEGRFTLQGYERVLQEGRVVEYAQSWLCRLDVTPA